MDIENVAAGAEQFTANAWLVEGTALVDAGSDPVVLERLESAELETVVITHSHHDHIENLETVVAEHNVTVHAFEPGNLPVDAERLDDGDEIELAGHTFDVYHTPGHRDDHVCLYDAEERVLFSGDLIFPGGAFGRTDLEQGDRDRLIDSIERIAALDVRAMYAGHGDAATDEVNEQIGQSLAAARRREPKY
ncbi:MAG: MBL fold metallo-hydrolase [Candidatus Nanohaloarchaea archaeon]|nr:MBL fold metallo-hydrolase [Candidatus Nanohaloarchaea archaeon]